MNTPRNILSVIAFFLLVAAIITESWGLREGKETITNSISKESTDSAGDAFMKRYQKTVVEWQFKLAEGIELNSQQGNFDKHTSEITRKALIGGIASSIKQFQVLLRSKPQDSSRDQREYLSFAQIVAAKKFKEEKLLSTACHLSENKKFKSEELKIAVDSFAATNCAKEVAAEPLSEETQEKLLTRFGLLAKLFLEDTKPELRAELKEEALTSFSRFGVVVLIAIVVLPIMFFGCFYFLFKWAKRSFAYQYSEKVKGVIKENKSWLLFEAFILYLAGMLASGFVTKNLISEPRMRLPFSAAYICLLSLALLWPLLNGLKTEELRQALGLYPKGLKSFVKDLLTGPFVYISMVPLFMGAMMFYTGILSLLKVNPSSGAHPAVPALAASNDSSLVFWIAVLAVVVAPIIEELFFRGALYSWLRERVSPGFAIFLSAIIFAALHPQGAVGVFPLTLIGMTLAWVREWRGGILACIACHMCVNGFTLFMVRQVF